MPELRIETNGGRIAGVDVIRGAPCGATWEAAGRILGCAAAEAAVRMGLAAQFFCVADPSAWDPITGHSPVHYAGEFHMAAVRRALRRAVDPR